MDKPETVDEVADPVDPDAADVPADTDPDPVDPDEGDDDADEADVDDDDDAGDDDEADDDEGDDDEDEPKVEAAEIETEDPEDDPEWKNLAKKFAHIQNVRDRRAQIAKAYWGKAKYAKVMREENEALRSRIQEYERGKKDEKPAAVEPSPQLQQAEARINDLKVRGERISKRFSAAVAAVNEGDRQLAIARYELERIRPEDEDRPDKERLAKRLIQDRERDLEIAKERFSSLQDDEAELRERINAAIADRDWIQRFQAEQETKTKTEQTTREQFNAEFPKHVDSLILRAAKATGIDIKNKDLRRSVVRNVNRDLMIELQSMGDVDMRQVDLRGLVRGYVRNFAHERDLAVRKNFVRASKEKLAVARPTSGGKAPTTVKPAGSNQPVPVSLMGSDPTDKMAQARARLVQRFDRR